MQIRGRNSTQLDAALSKQVRADDSDFKAFWFNVDKEVLLQTIRKENDSASFINKLSRVMEICVVCMGTAGGVQVYELVSEGNMAHPISLAAEMIMPVVAGIGIASVEYIRKNGAIIIKSGAEKMASIFNTNH